MVKAKTYSKRFRPTLSHPKSRGAVLFNIIFSCHAWHEVIKHMARKQFF